MKKRTVGIYAKYEASEQCLCASFFAGYVVTCYRHVNWFTPNTPKRDDPTAGFSHEWDTGTYPKTKSKYASKVKECDTMFFFEPDMETLNMLPANAVTSFVLNPYQWDDQAKSFAKRCNNILLLSPEWFDFFSQYPYLRNIFVWPFMPIFPSSIRRRRDEKSPQRLFYPAYGLPIIERQFIRKVSGIVKLCRPDLESVIGFYHNGEQPEPGYDPHTFDWRLQKYLRQSDWIIDLNPQPLFGLFPSFACHYHLRWMGFNIPPHTDSYSQTCRHVIETKTKNTGCSRAVKAVPDAESTAEQIIRHIETMEKSQSDAYLVPGSWERRCVEFVKVTRSILGLPPSRVHTNQN
jgi:hypothetical protein